jgi:hypothetical protein
LRQIPKHFVLHEGTAIALRLGHRASVDFDFFTSESFKPEKILSGVPLLSRCAACHQFGPDEYEYFDSTPFCGRSCNNLPEKTSNKPLNASPDCRSLFPVIDLWKSLIHSN